MRARADDDERPRPYSFDELTEDGMQTETVILAIAGGDAKTYLWLCDNVPLSKCFEIYGLDAAWTWEPPKPKKP